MTIFSTGRESSQIKIKSVKILQSYGPNTIESLINPIFYQFYTTNSLINHLFYQIKFPLVGSIYLQEHIFCRLLKNTILIFTIGRQKLKK